MGIFSTLVYFVSTLLLVVSRVLAFEMFAYYLGPGNLSIAFGALMGHILLMSTLHLILSDSWNQMTNFEDGIKLPRKIRTVLLVLYNSLFNGLANIYVHNNIKIFFKCDASSINVERTLLRQIIFDFIFLGENIIMILLGEYFTFLIFWVPVYVHMRERSFYNYHFDCHFLKL